MQLRVIFISIVVIIVTILSTTIYGLYSKNKALNNTIDTLEQRIRDRDAIITSLEESILIQQQHIDNTTLKFKKEYDLLYNSFESIKRQHDNNTTHLIRKQSELARLCNSIIDTNRSDISLTVLGSIADNCNPTFKLVPMDISTKFTIFEGKKGDGYK